MIGNDVGRRLKTTMPALLAVVTILTVGGCSDRDLNTLQPATGDDNPVVFSDAFVWSDASVWSDAFVFSDAFVWSDAAIWSDAVTDVQPEGMATDAVLVPQAGGQPVQALACVL